MITDKEIIEKYNNCDHPHNKRTWVKNHLFSDDEINYINNRFNDSSCFNESIDRLLYNIEIRPVCKYCSGKIEYVGKPSLLFRSYCSNDCKNKDSNLVERNRIGCLKKYGVDNASKLNFVKEKKKQTHLKNYGTENNFGLESTKQTIINKYGVDNISKLDTIKEKKKETVFSHYGVNTYLQMPDAREKRKSKESLQKEYNTKKKNNSFNKSDPEDKSYLLLKEKYPDLIAQYRSEVYPFNCDFYIPSLDLYIECNYFWTHGGFPYIETEQRCIDKLNLWKYRGTKFYNNAIETWTIRDINKRKTAKEHNLNWIEFFDINELILWLSNN